MNSDETESFPLTASLWRRVARQMALSRQQRRIVELILRNRCDKQIAAKLGLKVPTVRTYLQRIYARIGAQDRLSLVLKILASSHGVVRVASARHRAR